MRFVKNNSRWLWFFLALFFFLWWLLPQDMRAQSGDAADIWRSIVSYHTDAPSISYVMYKGILSIFPYVWLYELAKKFQIDEFFFIKFFYSALFSYVSVLGMPFIWSRIAKKQISNFSILIFSLSLFLLWRSNFALNNLMIDLPSLAILIAAISCVIKIKETQLSSIFYAAAGGLFLGLLLCGSGQYQLSFYLLLLFVVFSFNKNVKKITLVQLFSITIMLLSIGTISYAEKQFAKTTMALADKNQEWFLTKKEWLDLSLSGRNMLWLKYSGGPTIDNVRLRTIGWLINENFIDQVAQGSYAYDPSYYAKLIAVHPIDFLTQWVNKLFLGVSLDNGSRSAVYLLYIYSLLYLAIRLVFKKIKKVKDLFNKNTLLVLAFILPSLAPLLFHVEMRYFLSIQILIIGSVLLNTTIREQAGHLKKIIQTLVKQVKATKVKNLDFTINYDFLIYLIFIAVCFSWYAAIYENVGITSEILFKTI